ncbi:MAG TPA: flagellar assembly protein FliX [Acidiphilium sp.]|nr:MAG: hypothetical protein B7Z67_08965 [Acidiphilium sp. 21-60-14]OYV90088.1 MAG: hypothetical protein B7Z57_10110 [Acidiphilium sp. 37-60-79]OZB39435.1 MAG: hypothetical protein B7X48_08990 [Acidiphilium sp. 34-60-192]HQT88235.1 flagellar assembly protein FliX [Acidiphilium sp.]HQU23441.1 flagellar assembly protein FliX [Acidiphilium sp.]
MSNIVGVRAAERVRAILVRGPRAIGGFQMAKIAGAAAQDVAPLALAGLLALQDDASPARRDRLARQGGEQVLTALESIQLGLLDEVGGGLGARLSALDQAVAGMSAPADPALAPILAQIRLRAQVELARRRCVHKAILEKS